MLSVHVADDEDVAAIAEEVVVKLVPKTCRCKGGARESGEGVECETVDIEEYCICQDADSDGADGVSCDEFDDTHDCRFR